LGDEAGAELERVREAERREIEREMEATMYAYLFCFCIAKVMIHDISLQMIAQGDVEVSGNG
jgi:hypothetical protein